MLSLLLSLRWLLWPLVASHALAFLLGRALGRGRATVHYHVQGTHLPRRRSSDDVIAAVLRLILFAAVLLILYKAGYLLDGSSSSQTEVVPCP